MPDTLPKTTQDKRPFVYFHPKDFGMRVLHKNNTLSSPALNEIWTWIGAQATAKFNKKVTFPAPDNEVVRHFTFAATQGSESEFMTYAYRQTEDLDPQDLPVLVEFIKKNGDKKQIFDADNKEIARLDAVDLNWLGVAGDWPGDGGPGGPPEPYPPSGPPPDPIPFEFEGDPLDFL